MSLRWNCLHCLRMNLIFKTEKMNTKRKHDCCNPQWKNQSVSNVAKSSNINRFRCRVGAVNRVEKQVTPTSILHYSYTGNSYTLVIEASSPVKNHKCPNHVLTQIDDPAIADTAFSLEQPLLNELVQCLSIFCVPRSSATLTMSIRSPMASSTNDTSFL